MTEARYEFEMDIELLATMLQLPAEFSVSLVHQIDSRSLLVTVVTPDAPTQAVRVMPVLTRHDDGTITWDFDA